MPAFLSKRPTWSRRSAERDGSDLTLRATEPDAEPTVALATGPEPLPVQWPLAAAVAGLLVAAVGWVLVVGLTVLGWLAVDADTVSGPLQSALLVGTQVWVYANGAGLAAGGLALTLVPWGSVALFAFLLSRCTSFVAARTARRGPDPAGGDSLSRTAAGIAVLAAAGYLAPVAVVALLAGAPAPSPQLLLVVVALVAAAAWGSFRALGVDPTARWPRWLRPVPTAVLGAQLVLLASGAAVVVTSLLAQLDRVTGLTDALGAGVTGNIALLFGQLAFAPDLLVWGAAYALGAGFGLGDGSVVAPAATHVGLLPGLPIFGGVPASGPGGPYQLLWLGAGVIAGLVAAWLVVRRRRAARVDETALVGGLSGVVGALVFVVLAWAASGALGVGRLTGLGPRLPELAVMAISTLGLAGMFGGLVFGLWGGRIRGGEAAEPADDQDAEATAHLDREDVLSGSR